MWPRIIETVLGAWLILTPFIFRGTHAVESLAFASSICGAIIVIVSLASFWRPVRRIHLTNGIIACWLIASAYFAWSRPGPPVAQNDIVVGLLLLMFFVIPTEGHLPSESWRRERANWRLHSRRFLVFAAFIAFTGCRANPPGRAEKAVVKEVKEVTIGGEDWVNPTPNTQETIKAGEEHFRHHCQVCHGLDGQNSGVPFAKYTSPEIADLASKTVQDYKDGQLKWIIENGIRLSGMPRWKEIINDEEMWAIVRYLRNLPPKGSVGVPDVYKEAKGKHEHSSGNHTHVKTKKGKSDQ
jgi:mono/diheme cytochrome c family protein